MRPKCWTVCAAIACVLGVGDVRRDPQRLATGLLDLRHGRRARQDVGGDDVGALARQGEAVRLSNSTRRPVTMATRSLSRICSSFR